MQFSSIKSHNCAHYYAARTSILSRKKLRVNAGQGQQTEVKSVEQQLLNALNGVQGRGRGIDKQQAELVEKSVALLESDGGIKDPTCSDLLNGRWQLLFTSRPTSASPIQNGFTGVDAFTVYQDVIICGSSECKVANVVKFGGAGELTVEALASTETQPLQGFTPRQGEGLPIFGKSVNKPPPGPNRRIDFQFDNAAFDFNFLPFNIPYPVPFRLLGDETKGWLDITYLASDGKLRLARGNKGTLFILVKTDLQAFNN